MVRQRISSGSTWESQFAYSRAVRVGSLVFVSGTTGIGPDGRAVGDTAAQAHRAFEIIEDALHHAGGSLEDVVRTRTFLTDIRDWAIVGKVHEQVFQKVRPASTVVQVERLIAPDLTLEIEVDAVLETAPDSGGAGR